MDFQCVRASRSHLVQDVRACTEALQAIQKEKWALEASLKDLTDGKDALEDKKTTKTELALKREVWKPAPLFSPHLCSRFLRESASSCSTPRKNSIAQSVMHMKNDMQASRLLNGCKQNMRKWWYSDATTTRRWKSITSKNARSRRQLGLIAYRCYQSNTWMT